MDWSVSEKRDVMLQAKVRPEYVRKLRELRRDFHAKNGVLLSMNSTVNLALGLYFDTKNGKPK